MAERDMDRELAIAIRAALLAMVAAIERRWGLGEFAPSKVVQLQPTDSVSNARIPT
jgi:hypothetical protein